MRAGQKTTTSGECGHRSFDRSMRFKYTTPRNERIGRPAHDLHFDFQLAERLMKRTYRLAFFFAAYAAFLVSTRAAYSQTLGVDFAADYSIVDLGLPPGIGGNLGGITFLDNNTLLIGGFAN